MLLRVSKVEHVVRKVGHEVHPQAAHLLLVVMSISTDDLNDVLVSEPRIALEALGPESGENAEITLVEDLLRVLLAKAPMEINLILEHRRVVINNLKGVGLS